MFLAQKDCIKTKNKSENSIDVNDWSDAKKLKLTNKGKQILIAMEANKSKWIQMTGGKLDTDEKGFNELWFTYYLSIKERRYVNNFINKTS